MTWQLALYMVAGVFLSLLVAAMEGDIDGSDLRLALVVGPFVGVPVFIIVLLLFFNWALLFRMIFRKVRKVAAAIRSTEGTKT